MAKPAGASEKQYFNFASLTRGEKRCRTRARRACHKRAATSEIRDEREGEVMSRRRAQVQDAWTLSQCIAELEAKLAEYKTVAEALDDVVEADTNRYSKRIAELESENRRLRESVAYQESALDEVDAERDRHSDAIAKAHRALGGDGVWAGRAPTPPPPNTGDIAERDALRKQLDEARDAFNKHVNGGE